MTRLPVADFDTMEKVLMNLGCQAARQKGATFSTGTRTEEQRPSPAIPDEILSDL
jgi:hypothetical protein